MGQNIRIKLNETDITSLVHTITNPSLRMSGDGTFDMVLLDRDGSLEDTYIDGSAAPTFANCQFKPVKVQDYDTGKYLFIGRVSKSTPGSDSVIISCEGDSKKLSDKSLPSDIANFIYAEGIISTTDYGADPAKVGVGDIDGNPLTMVADEHIGKGLLINDDSEIVESVWDAGSEQANTFNSSSGVLADTEDDDSDTYDLFADDLGIASKEIEINLDGANISKTLELLEVEIQFNMNVETGDWHESGYNWPYVDLHCYIYNYSAANYNTELFNMHGFTRRTKPDGTSIVTVRGSILLSLDDIADYIHDDAVDYDQMRIKCKMYYNLLGGNISHPHLDINFLNIKITYQTGTFSPVQFVITDNGADWIECAGVDFDDLGVFGHATNGDSFQIGETSTIILEKAFQFANLLVDIDTSFDKLLARNFKANNPKEVLTSICLLEDAYWYASLQDEGYTIIFIRKRTNFIKKYDATLEHNYDSEVIGTAPSDWTISNPKITIEASGGRAKVIDVDAGDDGACAGNWVLDAAEKLNEDGDYFEFEAYIETNINNADDFMIRFDQTVGNAVAQITFDQGDDKIYGNQAKTVTLDDPIVLDTWYKFKVVFDFTNSTYDVYIDGVLIESDIAFTNAAVEIIRVSISGGAGAATDTMLLDNFDITKLFILDSDYDEGFKFERPSNYYSQVRVLGNPLKGIDYILSDITIDSPLEWLEIDDSINTEPDAAEVGASLLARLGSIQESVKLTINADYTDFEIGLEYKLVLANPTKIVCLVLRKVTPLIDFPTGRKRVECYFGLGQTPVDEHIANLLEKALNMVRRLMLSGQNVATLVTNLSHNALTNVTAYQHIEAYTKDEADQLLANAAGVILYLEETNSDIAGYETLEAVYSDAAEQTWILLDAVDDELIEDFASASGGVGLTVLKNGVYFVHFHAEKTDGTKTAAIYAKFYSRTAGGVETLRGTTESTPEIDGHAHYLQHFVIAEDITINKTDRFVIKFYADVGGAGTAPDITLYGQGAHESYFVTPGLNIALDEIYNMAEIDTQNNTGSGNPQNYQCVYEGTNQPGKMLIGSGFENVDGTNQGWQFKCVVSPTRSDGKTFHITGVKVRLIDADDGDYIDTIYLYALNAAANLLDSWDNGGNKYKAAQIGLISESCGATRDIGAYDAVKIYISLVCTNAQDIAIRSVLVTGYYD